jgi:hypothetical protein
MISIWVIFAGLLIHWFADFVIQTHWQATNKSKNNKALTMHVLSYSTVWFLIINTYCILSGNYLMVLFAPITFVCHWLTDYFTSRLNSYLYAKGDVHNFFASVGFDQILHYVQLIVTYLILTK